MQIYNNVSEHITYCFSVNIFSFVGVAKLQTKRQWAKNSTKHVQRIFMLVV